MKRPKHKHRVDAYADVAAVAAYLNCSDRTVRRLLADGLRHVKTSPSRQGGVRIKWSDLDAWLEAHAIER